MFKIRHKKKDKFFKSSGWRDADPWTEDGKVYNTFAAARGVVVNLVNKESRATYGYYDAKDLEIVEFKVVEHKVYAVEKTWQGTF